MTVDPKALREAFKLINDVPIKLDAETAELLDESDPDGPVVLKNHTRNVVAMMPREVYEQIRRWSK